MKTISFPYSIGDIAKSIDIPFINSRPKMFSFLRKYGIITGNLPLAELVSKGYFTVVFRAIKCGSGVKTVTVVKVSKKGFDFIKKLAKLIFD